MLTKKQKQEIIKQSKEPILGSVVERIETESCGNEVHARFVILKSPSGDEFVIKPYDCFQLHIVQTLWGE